MARYPTPPIFHKTQLCNFFQMGRCTRGRQCRFAHSRDELQPAPDLKFTKLCPELSRTGSCMRGGECTFAHDERELRPHPIEVAGGGAPAAGPPPQVQQGLPPPTGTLVVEPMHLAWPEAATTPPAQLLAPATPMQVLCSRIGLGAVGCAGIASGAQGGTGDDAAESSQRVSLGGLVGSSPCWEENGLDVGASAAADSWSRWSTAEDATEPATELDRASSVDETWALVPDVGSDDTDGCPEPPFPIERVRQDRALPAIAAANRHAYTVVRTFVEVDEEGSPRAPVRRARSTGGLLSSAA